jgi:hypothetical protein
MEPPPVQIPLDFNPEMGRAIGLVTGHWTALEDSLCILMATLLGVDQARAEVVFYTSTNHKYRRDVLRALNDLVVVDQETRKLINELLKDVADLSTERNELSHHAFLAGPNRSTLTQRGVKPATKQGVQVKPVTAETILGLARRIAATHARLARLQDRLGFPG